MALRSDTQLLTPLQVSEYESIAFRLKKGCRMKQLAHQYGGHIWNSGGNCFIWTREDLKRGLVMHVSDDMLVIYDFRPNLDPYDFNNPIILEIPLC